MLPFYAPFKRLVLTREELNSLPQKHSRVVKKGFPYSWLQSSLLTETAVAIPLYTGMPEPTSSVSSAPLIVGEAQPTAVVPTQVASSVIPGFELNVTYQARHSSRHYSQLTGLLPGVRVLTKNGIYRVSNQPTLNVPPGYIWVISPGGKLTAAGVVRGGHKYSVGDPALALPARLYRLQGFQGAPQFTLNRVAQVPGEYITIKRLKHASLVHAGGIWKQADNSGTVELGPLKPGTYTVLVADREGDIYAEFEDAVPGDTFYTTFNFSQGYGYYGFYSGKAFAVRKVNIEVVEQFGFAEKQKLNSIKKIYVTDELTSSGEFIGSKGPSIIGEIWRLSDLPNMQPVKTTVYDSVLTEIRGWDHFRPYAGDVLRVDTKAQMFNTRIRVYDYLRVSERNNWPASIMVLDIIRFDDGSEYGKTKQTVYEHIDFSETSATPYREFIKYDKLLLDEMTERIRASIFAYDYFFVESYRSQSLMSMFVVDVIQTTARAAAQIASVKSWDSMLVFEQGEYTDVHKKVLDKLELITKTVGSLPLFSPVLDQFNFDLNTRIGTTKGELRPPYDPTLSVYKAGRAGADLLKMLDLTIPEMDRPDAEATQLVERVMMQCSNLRRDHIEFADRHVLGREIKVQDSFTVDARHSFDQPALFSPQSLLLTKIDKRIYRPELHLSKSMDGTMYAAYLRVGGGLYMAQSEPDGQWDGVRAKLVTNTPIEGSRSVGITEHKGSVYVCYAVSGETYTNLYVLKDGEAFWHREVWGTDLDIQVVSNERYGGVPELLVGYTVGRSESLSVMNLETKRMRNFYFDEPMRLDQVVIANGQIHWVTTSKEEISRVARFTLYPEIRLGVTETLAMFMQPNGSYNKASTLRAMPGDGLSLGFQQNAGVFTERGKSTDRQTEEMTVSWNGLRLRREKANALLHTKEHLYVDFIRVHGRKTLATHQVQVTEEMTLEPINPLPRIKPAVYGERDYEQLSTQLEFKGVRYERKLR